MRSKGSLSLLSTNRSKAWLFVYFLLNVFGEGVSLQTVVDQLPRLGKRELICLLLFTCYYVERFPLPLGAWDGLCYFIVALPEPSI